MPEEKREGKGEEKREGKGEEKREGKGAGLLGRENPFGGGCGWVVVAFIGPASIGVSELAARMLGGSGGQSGSGRKIKALGDAAILAQADVRTRAVARDKLLKAARAKSAAASSGHVGRTKTQAAS